MKKADWIVNVIGIVILVLTVLFAFFALLVTQTGCTVCPPCPTCEPCPTVEPTATVQPTPTPIVVPDKPACWDSRLDDIGVTLERRNGQYELVAAWAIVNGSWDDSAIPQCVFDNGWGYVSGADHNAFGRAETADGSDWMAEKFGLVWPDGGDTRAPEANGWANIPIWGGGGKYDWFVYGGDKLHGVTMPGNHHWSTYGVWRLRSTTDDMAAQDAAEMKAR